MARAVHLLPLYAFIACCGVSCTSDVMVQYYHDDPVFEVRPVTVPFPAHKTS